MLSDYRMYIKDCNLVRVRARHIIVRALVYEVMLMLRTRLSNLATRHSLIGPSIPETIAENILRKCEYAIVRLNIINAPYLLPKGRQL